MKVTVFATALLLAATGAMAAPTAGQTAPAEQAAATSPAGTTTEAGTADQQEEKKICRTERTTGSLTRRTRICMTASEWRELNAKTLDGITDMTRDRVGGGTTQGN